jgi:hypothetical protein
VDSALAIALDDDVKVGLSYTCSIGGTTIASGDLSKPNVTYRFPLGASTVVCTATDCKGNTAQSAPVTVTVVDTKEPTLQVTVPAPAEATSAAGATVSWTPVAADAVSPATHMNVTCGRATQAANTTFSAAFPVGNTTVTCSAADAAGNKAADVTFTVTVVDTTAPALTVAAPAPVEAATAAGANVSWTPDAGDATSVTCDGVTQAAGTAFTKAFPVGNTTVTCSAADAAGNKAADVTFTVTVVDTTAPALSVTLSITANATSAEGASVRWTPLASDMVSPASAIRVTCGNITQAAGTVFALDFPIGQTTVACIAKDAAGNTSPTESFAVTVADTTGPSLSVPVPAPMGSTSASGATVRWTPVASDAVSPAAGIKVTCDGVEQAAGTEFAKAFPVGNTTVTCTAVDAAGNKAADMSFTVTVIDATPPVVNVKAPAAIEATSAAGANVRWTPDAGDAVTITCDGVEQAAGTEFAKAFPLGNTTVTCTAKDAVGNSAAGVSFTVTVTDTVAPALSVTAPVPAEATSPAGATVRWTPVASDAVSPAADIKVTCNGVTQAAGAEFSKTTSLGNTTVICSAVDAAGNRAADVSFPVTVTDTKAPQIISLPADITITANTSSAASVPISYAVPTATDASDPSPVVVCSPGPGSPFTVGSSTKVVCTARDATGNSAAANFTITVLAAPLPPPPSPPPAPSGSNSSGNTTQSGGNEKPPNSPPGKDPSEDPSGKDEKMGLWVRAWLGHRAGHAHTA